MINKLILGLALVTFSGFAQDAVVYEVPKTEATELKAAHDAMLKAESDFQALKDKVSNQLDKCKSFSYTLDFRYAVPMTSYFTLVPGPGVTTCCSNSTMIAPPCDNCTTLVTH